VGIEQINGKLESFSLKAKDAHARVRVRDNELINLSIADRGVVEGEEIRPCTSDERRKPLKKGATIRVDRELERDRRVIAWAPK
jgi:hypothetical protein